MKDSMYAWLDDTRDICRLHSACEGVSGALVANHDEASLSHFLGPPNSLVLDFRKGQNQQDIGGAVVQSIRQD